MAIFTPSNLKQKVLTTEDVNSIYTISLWMEKWEQEVLFVLEYASTPANSISYFGLSKQVPCNFTSDILTWYLERSKNLKKSNIFCGGYFIHK